MINKRIIIPLLLILFMTSMAAFGAPVYVNVGPTTEFDGDIKILSEIVAEGTTADGWETTVFFTDPTADRTITIPDADVTVGVVTGIVPPDHGGTGIANNAASTITITGNFATTITVSNVTTVTLPTSGIIVSDATACTDIEGTGLSIAAGVLNWACTVNGIDSDNYTDGSIDHEHLAADVISGMTDVTSADADYIFIWDATDSLLKKCDMGEVRGAAGGASAALDNLAAVQINTTLLSDTADTDSLGTAAAEWLNLYIGDLGKIYCGLAQDISIHRSAAGVMTLTAANGVVTSAALTVTGALGIGANNLTLTGYVGRDADNFLGFDVDNTLKIEINNVLHSIVSISDGVGNNDKLCTQGYADDAAAGGGANVALSNLAGVAINLSLVSDTADTDSLGSATSEWLNLYLGTYGTVYFGTGQTENIAETALNELTITATTVAISGTLAMGANSITMSGSIGVTGTRVTKGWFTDLESTNAPTVGGTAMPLKSDKLSVFAATSSAELAGVISDETGTLKLVYSDSPVFTTQITTPSIVSTADLKIQPTATGDVILFGDTDVGDAVNGKSFYIYRKAVEGDQYYRFYYDQWGAGILTGSGRMNIRPAGSLEFTANSGASGIELRASVLTFNKWDDSNAEFTHYGYLTAPTARKYIAWQVDDADDYFHLSREDTNILGFKVGMPLDVTTGNIKASAGSYIHTVVTMGDTDLTPDVSAGEVFVSQSNTNPTAITDLDNPTVGQIVTIVCGNANNAPTIADGGNFKVSAAWNSTLDDSITFFVKADNYYIELSRSVN